MVYYYLSCPCFKRKSQKKPGKGPGLNIHIRRTAYRCSLPGLTGFAAPYCMRPGPLPGLVSVLFLFKWFLRVVFFYLPLKHLTTGIYWRRERDSNPRYHFWRYTRFPIAPLQPLGHLSGLFSNNSDYSTKLFFSQSVLPYNHFFIH